MTVPSWCVDFPCSSAYGKRTSSCRLGASSCPAGASGWPAGASGCPAGASSCPKLSLDRTGHVRDPSLRLSKLRAHGFGAPSIRAASPLTCDSCNHWAFWCRSVFAEVLRQRTDTLASELATREACLFTPLATVGGCAFPLRGAVFPLLAMALGSCPVHAIDGFPLQKAPKWQTTPS